MLTEKENMGIPDAGKVYEGTYGADDSRVLKEEDERDDGLALLFGGKSSSSRNAASVTDFSLDLVDLPTFSIATVTSLGREVAAKISSNFVKGEANLGQMILFFNKSSGQLTDSLHDEHNILTDDDTVGYNNNLSRLVHVGNSSSGVAREFYGKLKNIDRRVVEIKRIPIKIPSCQEEVSGLMKPPIEELTMTPSAEHYKLPNYDKVSQWLLNHESLKPRRVMTNALLYASYHSGRQPSMQKRYRDALYVSEFEGLKLLYAHRIV